MVGSEEAKHEYGAELTLKGSLISMSQKSRGMMPTSSRELQKIS